MIHMLAPTGISNVACSFTGTNYIVDASGGVLVSPRDVPDLVKAGFVVG
jgi:hypothetical protein